MAQQFDSWAKAQLTQLLPLDDESLRQIIQHAQSLPKDAASENLKSLLGDSPKAFEFISSFNLRRPDSPSGSAHKGHGSGSLDAALKPTPKHNKKRQPFNHLPPPRKVDNRDEGLRAYQKQDQSNYMPAKSKQPNTFALQATPDATQAAVPMRPSPAIDATVSTSAANLRPATLPPSAAGPLISDSRKSSRAASPVKSGAGAPKTTINITGGASMRGASTTLSELDSAIRSLEIQTDPTKVVSSDAGNRKRRCNCGAQRHALLAAAPNCLSCGKIICAKEGLGPCTFCGAPLLSSKEIHDMIRVLKEERGKERQNEHNAAHKRADVGKAPRPFASSNTTPVASVPGSGYASDADGATDKSLDVAKAHRDQLLKFQAENAKRTQIRDEAADYETPDMGLSMWASPVQRAQQLKRQQKILKEQEWNAKPEYEKRKMVMSLDVRGGKAVRRMQEVSREEATEGSDTDEVDLPEIPEDFSHAGGGNFAKNPLLGELVRPVYNAGTEAKGKGRAREKKNTWRRVQDDNDDNEQWILDGGAYGDNNTTVLSSEEPSGS